MIRNVRSVIIVFLNIFLCAVVYDGCTENSSDIFDDNDHREIHYVAVDIDDIFQPNWDSEKNIIGNIKMNASDVGALLNLSDDLDQAFGGEFKFSIGYNLSFFDSTNSGDKAFVTFPEHFLWFNHFPRHEHINESYHLYTQGEIENLFSIGKKFEETWGLDSFMSNYHVPPQHQGVWPPYQPLYDAYEEEGIKYTSAANIDRFARYGNVSIGPRYIIGIGSSKYSHSQVSPDEIKSYAQQIFTIIMENPAVILYSHQANYAEDRLANELLLELKDLLLEQTQYHIIFLPAQDLFKKYYHE